MLIRIDEVPDIEVPDNDLVMKHAINRDRHSRDLSVTWVRIDGRHRRLASTTGDRVLLRHRGRGTLPGRRRCPGGHRRSGIDPPRMSPTSSRGASPIS